MVIKVRGLVIVLVALVLVACESKSNKALQPTLMAAQKQFETTEQRDLHIVEMRNNHMNLLQHKRDKTVYQGIRTPKHSLHGCIDCHVPTSTVERMVKHTDSQHFCTTCHIELAVKIDCFQCHADRPLEQMTEVVKP